MTDFNSKNDKQVYFNQVKGLLTELNDAEKYCNLTLKVGHENCRDINFVLKKHEFDVIAERNKLGDKVSVKFYLTSRFKNGRWYTMANVLEVSKDIDTKN